MSENEKVPAVTAALAAQECTSKDGGRGRGGATLRLALAQAVWGTVGLFVLQAQADPLTIAAWRCVFGAGTLVILCLLTRAFRKPWPGRRILPAVIVGGLALVLNWVFLFYSYQHTSLTIATVAYHMEPFFLLGLGAVIGGERLTRGRLSWIVLAFAGLILAVGALGPDGLGGAGTLDPLAVGAALLAGFLYAVATFAAQRTHGVDPYLLTLIHCGIGAVLLLPFSSPGTVPSAGWWWIAGIGVIHTGLLYSVLYGAVRVLPTPVIAVLSFVYPATAVLADIVAYGRWPSLLQWLGIAVIAVATLRITARAAR